MKNKMMERILKNIIKDRIISELYTKFNKRDIFLTTQRIEIFGPYASTSDLCDKLQFRVHDILIFEGNQAHILQMYGQITEHGVIMNVEVEKQKKMNKGVIYE